MNDFNTIFANALWESFFDWRNRFEVGVPLVTGSFGIILNFAVDLSLITICLGAATGALGIVEKGIKIYKEIKSLKETNKTNKKAEDKLSEEEFE